MWFDWNEPHERLAPLIGMSHRSSSFDQFEPQEQLLWSEWATWAAPLVEMSYMNRPTHLSGMSHRSRSAASCEMRHTNSSFVRNEPHEQARYFRRNAPQEQLLWLEWATAAGRSFDWNKPHGQECCFDQN